MNTSLLLYGLCQLSAWQYVLVTLALAHLNVISVTLFLHRAQAHRSLELHPILSHFFRFWVWLGTAIVTKEWVAIHRKHHAAVETEEDPHSPQQEGVARVLFAGWWILYRAASRDKAMIERFGQETPNDWIERSLYTPHSLLGVMIMLALDLVLLGAWGAVVWLVHMMWIPFFAAGVVNGVGHYWGYRNFECTDASTNMLPLGLLLCGEELHNNHHTFPVSAKFSYKWWEFDMGWLYIQLFRALGLLKVKRQSSNKLPYAAEGSSSIDLNTLRAFLVHRFQVMDQYTRWVLLPIFKQEQRKLQQEGQERERLFCGLSKKLLLKESLLISHVQQHRLDKLLLKSPTLNTVYQLKVQLQNIWKQARRSRDELLESLCEWCDQAEATGIESLRYFVEDMRRWSLPQSHPHG